jgi:hypothetical protein
MKDKRIIITMLLGLCFLTTSKAQQFGKGWTFPMELAQGIQTPNGYVGSLQFTPSITVIEKSLRFGAGIGTVFNGSKFDAYAGPRLSLKLKGGLPIISSADNATSFLFIEHFWGTNNYKVVGGGIGLEVFEIIVLSVKAHYNYELSNYLIQTGIGINLFTKKESNGSLNN